MARQLEGNQRQRSSLIGREVGGWAPVADTKNRGWRLVIFFGAPPFFSTQPSTHQHHQHPRFVAPTGSRIPEAPRARAPSSPTTRALRHHAVDANQPRLCGKRCRHHGHRNPSHRHGQDSAPGERHQGRAQLRGARNLRHGIHHPQGGGPEAASADRRSRPETRRNPTLSP